METKMGMKTLILLLILSINVSAQTDWNEIAKETRIETDAKVQVDTEYINIGGESVIWLNYSMRSEGDTSSYCKGFKKGYIEGYCYKIIGCVEPIPPICPIPDVGFESYKDGYNEGFLLGREHRKKKQ